MVFSRARSQALGVALREWRERAGLTTRGLAEKLGWSHSKVSFLEAGVRSISMCDAARYLAFCQVSGVETDKLINFFRAHDGYWLQPHKFQLPDELIALIALETTASHIHGFEPMVIPGLLQTEDYIRALLRGGGVVPEDQIDQWVRARKERQVLLRRSDPPRCTFFIHENALRMEVGNPRIMNDQLLHLVFASSRPHITIRVIPASVGAYAGLGGPFRLMAFDRPMQQSIAYLEHEVTSLFLDTPEVIRKYTKILTLLDEVALNEGQSRSEFATLAGNHDRPREDRDGSHPKGCSLA